MFYSFRGASTHKFLIDHVLVPLSEAYASKCQSKEFLVDLIQLNVKHLLEIRQQYVEEDTAVVTDFSNFLKEYIKKGSKKTFSAQFDSITVSIQNYNNYYIN